MMELIFSDKETGRVNWAVTNVSRIRYITPSEVGYTVNGRDTSSSFPHNEKLEVMHL